LRPDSVKDSTTVRSSIECEYPFENEELVTGRNAVVGEASVIEFRCTGVLEIACEGRFHAYDLVGGDLDVEFNGTPNPSTVGKGPVAEALVMTFVAGTGVPVPEASLKVP
jgi:hypothetical protein